MPVQKQSRVFRWKNLAYGSIGIFVVSVLIAGWLNQTDTIRLDLDSSDRVFLVSNAGPIEITNGPESSLERSESWLLNRPSFEALGDDDEVVIRVLCDGWMPCRASTVFTVAPGTEVVVVASGGTILVDSFDGQLTVYDDFGDTVLGDVRGSAKVVSAKGRVFGSGLDVDSIDISTVSSEISLDFARLPDQLLVVTGPESTRLRLPDGRLNLDIESPPDLARVEFGTDDRADSVITIRSLGPVTIIPTVASGG